MERFITSRVITVLNALLVACVAAAAGAGIFVPAVYGRESLLWGAQGTGQDVMTFFAAVPAMIVSFFMAKRGSRAAFFVWLGTVSYTAYSYILYCYATHFNVLFLLYCACLGLSVYTLIAAAGLFEIKNVPTWFEDRANKAPAIYLLAVSALFYFLWLSEIIPALISGSVPKSVTEAGLMVNPVQVNDIALLLPAFIISSVLLLKKRPAGYFFFPAMMVFGVFMDLAIIGMIAVMKVRGAVRDIGQVYIFAVMLGLQLFFVRMFLKGLKRTLKN